MEYIFEKKSFCIFRPNRYYPKIIFTSDREKKSVFLINSVVNSSFIGDFIPLRQIYLHKGAKERSTAYFPLTSFNDGVVTGADDSSYFIENNGGSSILIPKVKKEMKLTIPSRRHK